MSKRKRIKKRKKTRRTVVLLSILLVFAVILVIGLYQLQPIPKKPASEYFEIFEATVDDGEFRNPSIPEGGSYENSSVLIVYGLSFKLRAVGGDAHFVVVKSWATANPVPIDIINKGQYEFVQQYSLRPYGLMVEKDSESGKFRFTIGIKCSEAEGDITFDL